MSQEGLEYTMNDTIGIYYELPNKKIAYVYGWDTRSKEISYYFNGDNKIRSTSEKKWFTWKPRKDLKDFPNAKDPRLPYVFDLFWDLKYKSQLTYAISDESYFLSDDIEMIKREMLKNNIVL